MVERFKVAFIREIWLPRTGDREIRSESGRLPELSARLCELSGKVGMYAGIELTMRRTSEHGKLGMRRPGIEIVKTEKEKKKRQRKCFISPVITTSQCLSTLCFEK